MVSREKSAARIGQIPAVNIDQLAGGREENEFLAQARNQLANDEEEVVDLG